jgi:CheY-like chemotaxis protein
MPFMKPVIPQSMKLAILLSVLSASAWWWADAASGHFYSQEWLRIWDAFVRLMFFCLVVLAGSAFKQQRDAIRARIELLERSQRLEQEIIRIKENEQQRIGRDLHDGVCRIRETSPDLAIVDITLKGSSGLELIKSIKALSVNVPILVLSMHDESLYAERALRALAANRKNASFHRYLDILFIYTCVQPPHA